MFIFILFLLFLNYFYWRIIALQNFADFHTFVWWFFPETPSPSHLGRKLEYRNKDISFLSSMLPLKPTAVDRAISALAWHETQGCHGLSIFPGPGRSQRIRIGWDKGHRVINIWSLRSSNTLPPPCLLLSISCYKNKIESPVTKQFERGKGKKNSQESWIKLRKLFSTPFFICNNSKSQNYIVKLAPRFFIPQRVLFSHLSRLYDITVIKDWLWLLLKKHIFQVSPYCVHL